MYCTEVIITTYNGASYISEQLYSIFNQTRKPDVVSIYDDKSSDNTTSIIMKFIIDNNLSNWRLFINKENMGWKRNFYEAMKKSSGDIIFFADQDDIWNKEKIEKMVNIFLRKQHVKVLVSDYDEFYEDGADAIRFKTRIGNNRISKIQFDIHFNEIRRPGCTMAFRREMINVLDSFYFDGIAHDQAVWISGLISNGLYYYKEKLIRYRRHAGNASPISGHTFKLRLEELKLNRELVHRLLNKKKDLNLNQEQTDILKEYYSFINRRITYISKKNIIRMLLMIKRIRNYPKFLSWVGDIYVLVKG